jgi:hypothetical protein
MRLLGDWQVVSFTILHLYDSLKYRMKPVAGSQFVHRQSTGPLRQPKVGFRSTKAQYPRRDARQT